MIHYENGDGSYRMNSQRCQVGLQYLNVSVLPSEYSITSNDLLLLVVRALTDYEEYRGMVTLNQPISFSFSFTF